MIEVVRLERPDTTWDRFVEQHPAATAAHLGAWGPVITRSYGHEVVFLMARDGADVVGALPLVLLRSRIFGHRLVSMPFLDYGGILAEPGSEAEAALARATLDLARRHKTQSVGLRQLHPTGLPHPPTDGRVTMLLELTSEQAVWKALPSERRNRIRKGQKNGLVPVWGGRELIDDFYRVFATNMRDLGSPVHHRRFFDVMFEELGSVARLLVVRDADQRAVGAAVVLVFRDTIIVPGWVSSLREAFHLCPNFVLYWEVISHGCRHGYRTLDFGRSSRDAGTFEFKRQWGARPHALPWVFVEAVPGSSPPVDQDAGRFEALVRIWKRIPLPVANLVGPWIRGQVPN
jgi:FemAB-related protein (PEP-CTERM system-associated)